jgi:hypothetical protein
MPPSLHDARSQVHDLYRRINEAKLRIARGEVIEIGAANRAMAGVGISGRDRLIIACPVRHGAQLASEFDLRGGELLVALSEIMRAECFAIAYASWVSSGSRDPEGRWEGREEEMAQAKALIEFDATRPR